MVDGIPFLLSYGHNHGTVGKHLVQVSHSMVMITCHSVGVFLTLRNMGRKIDSLCFNKTLVEDPRVNEFLSISILCAEAACAGYPAGFRETKALP